MGLFDFSGLDKQVDKIVKSGKLICPFTVGSKSTGMMGLTMRDDVVIGGSIPCGAWCKLYNNERQDCRLVTK